MDRHPTANLPASQRPTPTSGIRLHSQTLRVLDALRLPDETWELFMVRAILAPRAITPPDEPRHIRPRPGGRRGANSPLRRTSAPGLGAQEPLLQVGRSQVLE